MVSYIKEKTIYKMLAISIYSTEPKLKEPIQSIDLSINQSINRSINQSFNQLKSLFVCQNVKLTSYYFRPRWQSFYEHRIAIKYLDTRVTNNVQCQIDHIKTSRIIRFVYGHKSLLLFIGTIIGTTLIILDIVIENISHL